MNGKNTTVPTILNTKCNNAALCAVLLVPTLASIAVIQVPMLHPKTIGNAKPISINPVEANAINIPVVADELCNKAVIAAPAIIPINQLSPIASNISVNIGDDAYGFIAPLIAPIPVNSIPNPRIMLPISFLFLAFANITNAAPTNTNIGAT